MTTPTGTLSLPIEAFRDMLSESADWQSWTGAASQAAAKDLIHVVATDESPTRPFALVDYAEWSRERKKISLSTTAFETGESALTLYFTDDATGDEPDSAYDFMNNIGAVLSYLEEKAGEAGTNRLAIVSIEMIIAPTRTQKTGRAETGDYYEAAFLLTFSRQPR